MPLPDRPVWRLLTSTLLAVVLGIAVVAGTVAQDSAPSTPAATASPAPSVSPGAVEGITDPPSDVVPVAAASHPADLAAHVPHVVATAPSKAASAPTATSRPKPTKAPATAVSPASYKGTNHVWMPALGIDKTVSWYACSNTTYPGNRVYRWGCAGDNNIYLFGHASSVFQPLHDAYVDGRLKKGMSLWYAGADGVVHAYTIAWWKVTTPTKGVWAYAAQSTASLTLQTCLGSQSQYRLIVRLAQAD
jgi:sortase (surface protein transpeptidase)